MQVTEKDVRGEKEIERNACSREKMGSQEWRKQTGKYTGLRKNVDFPLKWENKPVFFPKFYYYICKYIYSFGKC